MQKHYKTKKHPSSYYKMRGCSKKSIRNHKKRGHYLGGSNSLVTGADFNLAYSYNGPVLKNDSLAYTGKGGYKGTSTFSSQPANVNGANPLYPNTGPQPDGFNFLNPMNQQRGGGCGCGMPFMSGGGHRSACKCSTCKGSSKMNGGGCSTSNNGTPFPNGLVGAPYNNPTNLPGANGVVGNANYYANNTYNNDISRQMTNVGANPPFLSLKGGRKGRKGRKTRKMRGGNLTNLLGQDLVNLTRQFTHGIGTAYNGLQGYPASPNPLPWKDQLVSKQ
jgi:hypothetical protein